MKHLFSHSLILSLSLSLSLSAQTLAFPEAEGFGRFASGGRGGKVYYVTSLADCSDNDLVEGTLRWALRDGDDSPRTVLFKVCGTIYLTSKLKLNHPNITIAGQTAPGGGICIAGANIYVCKPNVIIRHIRFRAGDIPNSSFPSIDVENTKHVILDHCSLTWSMEECLTMYDTDSTTVQYCIIGEALYYSKHVKKERSYATQWGGEHSTMHHCLITNCVSRTPRFNGVRDEANLKSGQHAHDAQVDSEFTNNVIYNFAKKNSVYGGENDTSKNHGPNNEHLGYNHVYMLNNYFRSGPTTLAAKLSTRYFVQAGDKLHNGQWLLRGNKFETDNRYNYTTSSCWQTNVLDLVNQDNLYGYTSNSSNRAFNLANVSASQAAYDEYILPSMIDSSGLVLESADQAFRTVCTQAGAQLPRLDEVDQRLLLEASDSVHPIYYGSYRPTYIGIIDSQKDITLSRQDYFYVGDSVVGGYPFLDALSGDSLVLDTDEDGLPDAYEIQQALDPVDPTDAALITTSGYSNLENYLNGVASGTIDKTQYETLPYVSQEPVPPTALPFVLSPSYAPRKVIYRDHLYIINHRHIYQL